MDIPLGGRTAAASSARQVNSTSRCRATGCSIRAARSNTGFTATHTAGSTAPLSSRVKRSKSSVMRSRRLASAPMSETNSRVVAGSIFSV